MLSKEQLREIRAALTWGDHRYGREQAGDKAADITAHAMHRRAEMLELTDGDFEAFLDSVNMEDLGEVLGEERDPTLPSTRT